MASLKNIFFLLLLFFGSFLFVQKGSAQYLTHTKKSERTRLMNLIVEKTIHENLTSTLNNDNEYKWQDAFDALEVYQINNPFVFEKIKLAFDSISNRSPQFQRALLELIYTNYSNAFIPQVQLLLAQTLHPKIFAMCAEYLMHADKNENLEYSLREKLFEKFGDTVYENPILHSLHQRIKEPQHFVTQQECIHEILKSTFLPNQLVLFSFQRKNRNYPGLLLIRDSAGNFIKDSSGELFHISQLARSISNLPGYLTNGNTPQGIFSMMGLGISMSAVIGPTPNIQMGMPIEVSLQQFFHDSTLADSSWSLEYYQQLIPPNIRGYSPLYETYYAGLAGRTEIIAHGTTLDPKLYVNQPYYPLTPTQGCLCTKEIWDGERIESDQQKLIDVFKKIGDPIGYVVVIEVDDKNEPITIKDLTPFFPK